MYLAGAALAWNANGFPEEWLKPVLSRDVFGEDSGYVAQAALKLGFVHRKLKIRSPNETPLGTVIAAPPAEERELFCRNGLKWFKNIKPANIRATLKEIEKQRVSLKTVSTAKHRLGVNNNETSTRRGGVRRSSFELDLAARMAVESCHFMLWQQAMAARKALEAKRLAKRGIHKLRKLKNDFNRFWPLRNKATPKHCSAFLDWRINDYRRIF
jgi:hypothetical protein